MPALGQNRTLAYLVAPSFLNTNWGAQSFRRRHQTVQNLEAPLSELPRSQLKATNICHQIESEITRCEVQYRY